MIKVNDLQKGKKNRYIVTLNEKEYDVNENLILNYHLIKGYVIEDDKVLDDIISDISYYDFYDIALTYLERNIKSSGEIKNYLKKKGASDEISSKIVSALISHKLLDDKKIKYNIIDKKKMDSMFPQSQGYGAYASDYQYVTLEESLSKKTQGREIYLILDGLEDPHNFGAILRSADAFGVKGVIIPKNRSVSVTEVVAHVSTGAIEYVDIIMVNNLNQALIKLKDNGYWIVGTDASGDKKASELPKDLNLAVIIGSEGFGMSRLVKKQCDYMLQIPMVGHVNSLNASVSCGIVLALINE